LDKLFGEFESTKQRILRSARRISIERGVESDKRQRRNVLLRNEQHSKPFVFLRKIDERIDIGEYLRVQLSAGSIRH